jgi:hypothetical protein
LARKFLYLVVVLIMLTVAGAFAYRLFGVEITRWAMVPKAAFEAQPPVKANAYADPKMWLARPDMRGSPALWTPAGYQPGTTPQAAVFFIHPTSYLASARWNAPLDDQEANDRAILFLRAQATAFNEAGAIWAPRYRQATFGAFLTGEANARRALDFAYRDVLAAYEEFLREAPADRPIILAAHSQGSAHLMRLLQERIRGAPEAQRVLAAYLVGWPVSVSADLPALPLPACETPDEAACILSWQSFSEPADPSQVTEVYDESIGPGGARRAGSAMLCTNPLTGTRGGAAPAARNLGTLVPNEDMSAAEFRRGAVPARCDLRGFLLIGPNEALPAMGPYALPGNNYHVYDYALFWANIRTDATRRLAAFEGRR